MSQTELATHRLFGSILLWITPAVERQHVQYARLILKGGTSAANFNTSNLIKYLNMYHVKGHNETALPKLYETVRHHISCWLKDMQTYTSDIWTSDVCPMSMLSLHTGWTQYRRVP